MKRTRIQEKKDSWQFGKSIGLNRDEKFSPTPNTDKGNLYVTFSVFISTPDLILADVRINPGNPRHFFNYSGDLSGRYIEVMSHYCKTEKCDHRQAIMVFPWLEQ